MNCDAARELMLDRVGNRLPDEQALQLDAHLARCSDCRREFDAVVGLWKDLDTFDREVPTGRLSARFHAALAAYEQGVSRAGFERWQRWLWPPFAPLQTAAAIALVAAGFALGRWLPSATDDDIEGLRQELRGISLALLNHQSASERLRGVEWTRADGPSPAVIAALIDTVRTDSSINVRLAAVEALAAWLGRAPVDDALLDALDEQSAPLLQVAIAELLLDAQIGGSREAVARMIERDTLDPAVRDYLSQALGDASSQPDIL